MANDAGMGRTAAINRWRLAGWGTAALLLLLPFVAMQFTREVNWTAGDFLFAGLMFGSVGLAIELAFRATGDRSYRAAASVAVAAAFLTVWINGAVGMIGSEENDYNLLFLGVVALAMGGAAISAFRARGMALAMAAAAAAQLIVSAGGAFSNLRDGIFASLFALMWLMSASLFRRAAQG